MSEPRSLYRSRSSLEEMLARGWEIEPPVYARVHWRRTGSSTEADTYHFVLWREDRVHLVSVRDSPEIQRFLADSELAVDRL